MQKFVQFFSGKVEVTKDLIFLLIIGGLYALGIFLSNTFVNVYLWKQSNDFMTIAIYNLAIYIFQPLTFMFAGRMAKKMDRIIVLRLGVIFLSLFFLSVLLLGEKSAYFNFMLGSLLGIGYGFYWLAYNVLTFEITEPETRDFFNGFLGILQSFGGMIGPLLAGIIISKMTKNMGYTTIFTISFILFILAVVSSFFLNRRLAEGRFYLKEVLRERSDNHNWKRILNAHIAQGLREGIFLFVITIWVFLVTNDELKLGLFNLFLSGLSFVFYFGATKFIKPSLRKKAIFYASIFIYFSLFIILLKASYLHFIIYAIIVGAMYPILNVPYLSLTYDVIGVARKAKEFRIEYIVVRELFVNVGRVISISVFILFILFFSAEKIFPWLLAFFGLGQLFIFVFIRNIHLSSPPEKEVIIKEEIFNEKNR